MATPPHQDSTESLNLSVLDTEKPSNLDNPKEQSLSVKDERMPISNPPRNAASESPSVDVTGHMGSIGTGFENATGEWGEYRHYVTGENPELGSPGIYNDNPSLMYHTGYGYNPQMPYGPYSPVTTPLSSVRSDAQLYSPQQFPFSGTSYYQQLVPQNMPYINSSTQTDPTVPVGFDQQSDGMLFGPRPGYSPQFGSFGRGNSYPGNSGNASFYDLRQGFDGFGSGALWSDSLKSSDGQRSLSPLSPAVSPQPFNMPGSFSRNVGMASQQQRPSYGLGMGSSSHIRRYPHNGAYQSSNFDTASFSSLGTNDRWITLDKVRRRVRDSGPLCSCNGAVDILSEQNRGPRASKPKNQATSELDSSLVLNKNGTTIAEANTQSYNRPDFVTDYNDAKFFVIKSYSEDNVHKSIKYGVWASTPNGNRKLDAAYHEAMDKQCPVFLLFSVNASAQFCGVAEMGGPVDFDKSVDYWQQDKWSGQFPVKWHMVKDVPNSQFRHIILENNDNKPVTNSRDTQEVKLEQGTEMLNIFKNYETNLSILDDFDYYEERQRVMQERKARQQATMTASPVVGGNEYRSQVPLGNEFVKQMSKSFAQAVRLDDNSKESSAERTEAEVDTSAHSLGKVEDTNTTVVSTVPSN